ncbi:eukaryotic translation initiation factor 3subunit A [Striga asiatica]|uniref:Eukaryotic translation initiation factor 3subunit A n=1 Tax=Striga asiatica TaxID=4170 RepID=A0A5A7PV89_STRAF|nr:eukaryotic translation initiation factor 3subunit A [Striga asiatica]
MEEETVKEVLSEIRTVPKIRPGQAGRAQAANRECESPFIKNAPLLSANAGKGHPNGATCIKPYVALAGAGAGAYVFEDFGSEICSTVGECESVCTNPAENREEKGEDSREHPRRMSPARRRNTSSTGEGKREKSVGRSPGRRSDPSPGRSRTGNGRRDGGEGSGRRSRSPAARTETGSVRSGPGRSPSARKRGKSPGRVGSGLGERDRKVGEERKDGGDRRCPPTNDESLENPLVSLECFIFL